jgi:hypothetical protein
MPLYEGKMVQAFDHRAASVVVNSANLIRSGQPKPTEHFEHQNIDFSVTPQYWVEKSEVAERVPKEWGKSWLLSFKSVTSPTNERTFISALLPKSGVAHSMVVVLPLKVEAKLAVCLYANLNSIIVDFVVRNKVGGLNMSLFFVKQFPVLSPPKYTESDVAFIAARVLELSYTSNDMHSLALDLGCSAQPFTYEPTRRAHLRAELDAWYARAYGLTREELRYILDPADVMGEDYPSETFRGLKKNEEREFGEYRTQRLVLEAWDKLERGELH